MDNTKASTDIDRKLAIYYHPLFQQIIRIILDLFKTPSEKFQVGLLEFVQFNLKLQKALLPSFQIDNALISGLNDWVKQVAQCLAYQGMVSTVGCVQVTPSNVLQLTEKQYDSGRIEFYEKKSKYIQQMSKLSNHDALKLLGVKINKQVFSKFMFDLCSTWCQFLDIELFSYFLIGLYIQISEGETIENSKFKNTLSITTIDLQFMEQFEEIKSTYNRLRKKQLRYYRAWCEWNYLRVNQAGQRLILKLDELHPEDNRILQLALVFQKAIQVINEQITNQNPQKQSNAKPQNMQKKDDTENKDFLILKKLNIEPHKEGQQKKDYETNKQNQIYEYDYEQLGDGQNIPQQFQIEIDEEGNMYLKRIVKLPVFGMKLQPRPFEEKFMIFKEFADRKRQDFRQVSNLYGKMDHLKIRLEHNVKNDPYSFKKNDKIQMRDKFYQKQKQKLNHRKPIQKTIHQKITPPPEENQGKVAKVEQQFPPAKIQEKVSLRQNKEYIHKVMAPSFLTDDSHNISYMQAEGQIYSTNANDEKREIKLGIPKIKNMDFRIKQLKSYHIVGKLVRDRSLINQKIRSASISMTRQTEESKLQSLKNDNKYIWSRYIGEEEVAQMSNYQQFYEKLEEAKKIFGRQFQSQFRLSLRPMFAYENRRYELGGIISKQDQQRFSERIEKLINKEKRREKRKKRKEKMRNYRKNFKNKNEKSLFEDIFINYHKEAIKEIKEQRKRHISMLVK